MAEEIVVWCDQHLHDGEHRKGTPVLLRLDAKEYRVDLCEACDMGLLGPLRDLLAVSGEVLSKSAPKAVKAAPRGPGPAQPTAERKWPCLICEKPTLSMQDVCRHLRSAHQAPTDIASGLWGTRCPTCGEEQKGYVALARHCLPHHGENLAQALLSARKMGDPHGVIKEIMARTGLR